VFAKQLPPAYSAAALEKVTLLYHLKSPLVPQLLPNNHALSA
jgi:hypothetical protein